jgi:hypothetical protein
MILSPDEYEAGIYVCPFCGVTNDPEIGLNPLPPDCTPVPTKAHALCTKCGRSLVNVVWVDGKPYGSTCCHKAVYTVRVHRMAKRLEALEKRLKALKKTA